MKSVDHLRKESLHGISNRTAHVATIVLRASSCQVLLLEKSFGSVDFASTHLKIHVGRSLIHSHAISKLLQFAI